MQFDSFAPIRSISRLTRKNMASLVVSSLALVSVGVYADSASNASPGVAIAIHGGAKHYFEVVYDAQKRGGI